MFHPCPNYNTMTVKMVKNTKDALNPYREQSRYTPAKCPRPTHSVFHSIPLFAILIIRSPYYPYLSILGMFFLCVPLLYMFCGNQKIGRPPCISQNCKYLNNTQTPPPALEYHQRAHTSPPAWHHLHADSQNGGCGDHSDDAEKRAQDSPI